MNRRYGWIRDLPDIRDQFHVFGPIKDTGAVVLPLFEKIPVYDQGNLGSCTAQALAAAFDYAELKEGCSQSIKPSRLFIYYNERELEGTISTDNGASLRDGMKTLNVQGCCSEEAWPYDIAKFADPPLPLCYQEAKKHRSILYRKIKHNLDEFRKALQQGFPFVCGISVYGSFETKEVAVTGKVPMPQPDESVLGGHAITITGYDDEAKYFTFRNSWGDQWGNKGSGLLPYDYLTNEHLASDFWTVTKVTPEPLTLKFLFNPIARFF